MGDPIDIFAALFARYLKVSGRWHDAATSLDLARLIIAEIKARPVLASAVLPVLPARKWGGKTAIKHLARDFSEPGAEDILRTLIENKADVCDASVLVTAAGGGNTGALKQLIEAKADVNSATENEWTPLMAAARSGRVDSVRLLLDAKADPSVRYGTTRSDDVPKRLAGKTAWEIACTELYAFPFALQRLASLVGPVPPPAPPAPRVDLEALASVLGDNQKSASVPRLAPTHASAGDVEPANVVATSPATAATAVDSTRSDRTESG